MASLPKYNGVGSLQAHLTAVGFAVSNDKQYGCDTHLALRKAVVAARKAGAGIPAPATLDAQGVAIYAIWLAGPLSQSISSGLGLSMAQVTEAHKGYQAWVTMRGGPSSCEARSTADEVDSDAASGTTDADSLSTDVDPATLGEGQEVGETGGGSVEVPAEGSPSDFTGGQPQQSSTKWLWIGLGAVAVAGAAYLWWKNSQASKSTHGLGRLPRDRRGRFLPRWAR